ncbi:hypothetical protein DW228_06380 [Bacteroides fragilis]|uniref:Uncharacterized protein n=1 Tax=Bacteroides fragilis TaxID=817 RepID=A0A396C6U9_BACFG|nr:hypothetical protein [Bacteroides fragilis]RHH14424.1 hypothetical protein DW228_06380 [Bacteroides fragilis]
MKTNLLTSRNLNHNSPREGLEAFKKAHRSIVMAEFTNMEGANMWKGYILQKIKDTYYFIPVSERCLYDEYTTQTGKYVACILYAKYVNVNIKEMWDIAMGIIEGPCSLEILLKIWELFGDVPINKAEEIEQSFMLWEKGTDRFDIWHWFDNLCPNGLAKDIMGL